MNFNQNAGTRNPQAPGVRKPKRISDVNAMGPTVPTATASPYNLESGSGPSAYDQSYGGGNTSGSFNTPPVNMGGGGFNTQFGNSRSGGFNINSTNLGSFNNTPTMPNQNYSYAAPTSSISQPQHSFGTVPTMQSQFGGSPNTNIGGSGGLPNQFTMFQQPMVQDMAMQYGQRLADQGKQLVENQFEKWIPVARLKYYYAVDNNYVINKLRLLFFPYTHKDWSLKYDQENPVQPRYDINAPDLYIPTMAYITYVVVAGLMLGMQNRFSPEQLGIQASSALAYSIFELVVYSITLYVVNIKTNLKTLDLLAFAGYKFVAIVASLMVSVPFHRVGYYATLVYTSLALGFFLLRTLKTKVLQDNTPAASSGAINYDPYGNPQQYDLTGGRKRKLYFLFLIVGGQAFLSFLLSKHLYLPDAATLDARNFQFNN